MLVDDHALVREGVSRLLEEEPDMRVVAAFADGHAAVRFAAREEPDVAILDISMPGVGGIDVARRVRAVSPRTRLLMLSMHAKVEYVQQALWAGANGYLLKESAGHEVAAAVRVVYSGQRYLGDGVPLRDARAGQPRGSARAPERARDGGAQARRGRQYQHAGGDAARPLAEEHRHLPQPPDDASSTSTICRRW